MGLRSVQFVEGEFYHVYNRGVDKRDIFLNHTDYERFTELLYLSNTVEAINVRDIKQSFASVYDFERDDALVAIGAYCLMPNHFHILLTPIQESGVSRFINKLATSYSMYFNKRYERSGSLFQGRFKAQLVDSDEYLKYLYAYIHLNPVKLLQSDWKERKITDPPQALAYASGYQYSSFKHYLGDVAHENTIVNDDPFPKYFATATQHKKELLDWLTYSE